MTIAVSIYTYMYFKLTQYKKYSDMHFLSAYLLQIIIAIRKNEINVIFYILINNDH